MQQPSQPPQVQGQPSMPIQQPAPQMRGPMMPQGQPMPMRIAPGDMRYNQPRRPLEKVEFANLPYSITEQKFREVVGGINGLAKAYLVGARGYAAFYEKEDADMCVNSFTNYRLEDHEIIVRPYIFRPNGEGYAPEVSGFAPNSRYMRGPQGGPGAPMGGVTGGYYHEGYGGSRYRPMNEEEGYRSKMNPYPNPRDGNNTSYGNRGSSEGAGYSNTGGSRYDRVEGDNGVSGQRPYYPNYQTRSWNDQGRPNMAPPNPDMRGPAPGYNQYPRGGGNIRPSPVAGPGPRPMPSSGSGYPLNNHMSPRGIPNGGSEPGSSSNFTQSSNAGVNDGW